MRRAMRLSGRDESCEHYIKMPSPVLTPLSVGRTLHTRCEGLERCLARRAMSFLTWSVRSTLECGLLLRRDDHVRAGANIWYARAFTLGGGVRNYLSGPGGPPGHPTD